MKKDTHPEYNDVCFVDVSSGKQFITRSTLKSKETVTVDGVEYMKHVCDITSDTHPAYTGKKTFVDTAGRLEKFANKYKRQRRG